MKDHDKFLLHPEYKNICSVHANKAQQSIDNCKYYESKQTVGVILGLCCTYDVVLYITEYFVQRQQLMTEMHAHICNIDIEMK